MPFFSFSITEVTPSLKRYNITENNLYFSKNTQLWKLINKIPKSCINRLEPEKRHSVKSVGKKILFCLPPNIGLGDAIEYASALKSVSDSNIFEKLGEISGTDEFANKLDDLYSSIDSENVDTNKIADSSSEVFMLFDQELKWRKDAAVNLMPAIEKYNLVIKHNIGLRLQSRLTKEQAKLVAKCNSVHRDISLNF